MVECVLGTVGWEVGEPASERLLGSTGSTGLSPIYTWGAMSITQGADDYSLVFSASRLQSGGGGRIYVYRCVEVGIACVCLCLCAHTCVQVCSVCSHMHMCTCVSVPAFSSICMCVNVCTEHIFCGFFLKGCKVPLLSPSE